MKTLLTFLLIMITHSAKAQSTLKIELIGTEYSDYYEEDDYARIDKRWKVEEDQWGDKQYTYSTEISTKKLPFKLCLIGACAEIKANGQIEMGGYFGDMDVEAEMEAMIPKLSSEEFFQADRPYNFSVNGGEYASGVWHMELKLKIEVENP